MTSGEPFHGTVFDEGRTIEGYVVESFLGGGNSGEVYAVAPEGEPRRQLALKAFMPIFQVRQLGMFTEIDADLTSAMLQQAGLPRQEYRFLSEIDHPFIVQVFGSGEVRLSKEEGNRLRRKLLVGKNPADYAGKPFVLPFILTSKVNGRPIDKAVRSEQVKGWTPPSLTRTLLHVAQALEYLHTHHRYLHGDVKAANVLIREADGFPMLIDFALCKNLNFEDGEADRHEHIQLQVDWTLTPYDSLPDTHPFRRLMHEGGERLAVRNLLFPWLDFFQYGKLLKDIRSEIRGVLPPSDNRYLSQLIDVLTDWSRVVKLQHGDLVRMVERLGAGTLYKAAAPQETDGGERVHLIDELSVVVPPELLPITRNSSLNRLGNIYQLSFLGFVLRGGNHSRLLHAYDTLRVAQALMLKLSEVPAFRMRFGEAEVLQLSALALLHDINHFPFLHIFYESELSGVAQLTAVDMMCTGELTGEKGFQRSSVYDLLDQVGISRSRFERIIFGKWTEQCGTEKELDQILNSILKSGVDVDKLSYMALDSKLSGLGTAAGLGMEELFEAATLSEVNSKGVTGYHLAFHERSVPQLEVAMNSRFESFRRLYWRSDNRGIMAVFLDVLRRLFAEAHEDVERFVSDNVFSSDKQLIENLDRMYRGTFDMQSGLVDILRQPEMRPVPVLKSSELHQLLSRQGSTHRIKVEKRLTEHLEAELSESTEGPHAVVIDVPLRLLDVGGETFVQMSDGSVRDLGSVSPGVRELNTRYHKLSTTATVYVSPHIFDLLDRRFGGDANAIERCVAEGLPGTRSQMQ